MSIIANATITGTEITVVLSAATSAGTFNVAASFSEARPASLSDADEALFAHGFGRVRAWDLGENGTVTAAVASVDNLFNGVRAARLDAMIGQTHGELELILAREINDGDLITSEPGCPLAVVAGSRYESGTMRLHMVGECKVWDERHTTTFPADRPLWVARKR